MKSIPRISLFLNFIIVISLIIEKIGYLNDRDNDHTILGCDEKILVFCRSCFLLSIITIIIILAVFLYLNRDDNFIDKKFIRNSLYIFIFKFLIFIGVTIVAGIVEGEATPMYILVNSGFFNYVYLMIALSLVALVMQTRFVINNSKRNIRPNI